MASKWIPLIFLFIMHSIFAGKYSKEANDHMKDEQPAAAAKQTQRTFRRQNINLIWEKAQKTLSGQKLKNLQSDLKIQDDDEIKLKKLKSAGQDKDGLKEAELRKRLQMILSKYNLLEIIPSNDSPSNEEKATHKDDHQYAHKQLFKDKKLIKLWQKAEKSGFTDDQLKILKEEFKHHQDKLDEYHQFMNVIDNKEDNGKRKNIENAENTIDTITDHSKADDIRSGHQMLKEKHRDIKNAFVDLQNKVLGGADDGPLAKDFEEVKVQALWNMAKNADFNADELTSLKEELKHYQHRIKKLKYMEEQLESDHLAGKYAEQDYEVEGSKNLKRRVKDMNYKVDKIHRDIETRIMQRHSEL